MLIKCCTRRVWSSAWHINSFSEIIAESDLMSRIGNTRGSRENPVARREETEVLIGRKGRLRLKAP